MTEIILLAIIAGGAWLLGQKQDGTPGPVPPAPSGPAFLGPPVTAPAPPLPPDTYFGTAGRAVALPGGGAKFVGPDFQRGISVGDPRYDWTQQTNPGPGWFRTDLPGWSIRPKVEATGGANPDTLTGGGGPANQRYPDTGAGAPDVGGWSPGRVPHHQMPWDGLPAAPVRAPAPAARVTGGPPPLSPTRYPGGHIPPPAPPAAASSYLAGRADPWEFSIAGPRTITTPGSQAAPVVNPDVWGGPTVAAPRYRGNLHPFLQIAAAWLRRPGGGA